MKSVKTFQTTFQNEAESDIDLDYCPYTVVDDRFKSREVGISDVHCETSAVNEAVRDVQQIRADMEMDVKQIHGDILSAGLEDHIASELTLSMECSAYNPDTTSHENQPTEFKSATRTYCCDCHCTRNFQQKDQTTLQSKSGNSDRENSSRQQLNHHSFGVENDIKLVTYRTRLKLSRKLQHATAELVSIRSDDQASEDSTIKLRRGSLNSNMALIVGYITTFVVLLCLCGVVYMMNHSADSKHMVNNTNTSSVQYAALNASQQFIETATEPRIIKDLPYRSVSKDEFENHLANSNNAGDLLKIFFDDQTLTAEQVNSIIHMKTYYMTSSDKKHPVDQQTDDYTDTDDVLQRNPVADDDIKARELALQHNSEVSNHPFSVCKHPQPELVPVELHSDDAVRYYYPKCTLLHRCRNTTGCCGSGSICVPKKKDGIELIDKYFLVIEHTPGSSGVKPAKDIVVGKRFVNHTACECQPLITETNCAKDCPRHFVKRRHSADCKCICRSGIKHCKQVIRGLAPLEEEGLACIKAEKCIVPDCLSGDFMINTGYCPALRRHNHNRRHHGKHRKRRG